MELCTWVRLDNPVLISGHALNKILKDMILRYKILQRQKVSYVPGWDCHGLPIELKAVRQSEWGSGSLTIREKARKFAAEIISTQMAEFKSWAVSGDWGNKYSTMGNRVIEERFNVRSRI
jgi:isoleucyl-tRNA synthetase